MKKLSEKLFNEGRPSWRYKKQGLWFIDKTKISKNEFVKYAMENNEYHCEKCAETKYDYNTGWAQFCREHAPTMVMNGTQEECYEETGISVSQIARENANMNIVYKEK